jgi:transposase
LCRILDEEDQEWRLNTILLMDGAAYHKSLKIKKFLNFMKIPTLFSSPYSPELCPIELIFN